MQCKGYSANLSSAVISESLYNRWNAQWPSIVMPMSVVSVLRCRVFYAMIVHVGRRLP